MLPKDAVDMVCSWAIGRTPVEFTDQMRVEVETGPRTLTLVECSLMEVHGEPKWLRVPAARLEYLGTKSEWTLYYFDRSGRARRYPPLAPSHQVQDLLEELEADPTAIFWG